MWSKILDHIDPGQNIIDAMERKEKEDKEQSEVE